MATQLTLYGAPTGNCLRAAMALKEAGHEYAVESLSLHTGEHRRAPFLDINPLGKVPALVLGTTGGERTVITQSNAIMFYAAGNSVDTPLLGSDPISRARVMERFFYFLTEAIAPSFSGFLLARAGLPDMTQVLETKAATSLAQAESFLESHAFMAGDSYSLADIAGFTVIRAFKDALDWSSLPRISNWFARVSQRERVKSAIAEVYG